MTMTGPRTEAGTAIACGGPQPLSPLPPPPSHPHQALSTSVSPSSSPIPASREPSVAASHVSKEVTGLSLSVRRAHVCEEEMGCTQHGRPEKHLLLLRARLGGQTAVTPHGGRTHRPRPAQTSWCRWRRGHLLEAPGRRGTCFEPS